MHREDITGFILWGKSNLNRRALKGTQSLILLYCWCLPSNKMVNKHREYHLQYPGPRAGICRYREEGSDRKIYNLDTISILLRTMTWDTPHPKGTSGPYSEG